MTKIRIVLSALILSVLIGCTQTASRMDADTVVGMVSNLRYVHDKRTGLCYAAVASRHVTDFTQNGFTITYVPCSPEVLALINSKDSE